MFATSATWCYLIRSDVEADSTTTGLTCGYVGASQHHPSTGFTAKCKKIQERQDCASTPAPDTGRAALRRCNSFCTRLAAMKSPRPGGTENISVSMPSELLGALRTRTGKRGVSAYVTAAVRHQLAMDGLAEIVAAYEAEHEALSEAEVQAAQSELFGDAPAPYASNDSAA
jgi:hypothetical protein